jgi:hypothetical protein
MANTQLMTVVGTAITPGTRCMFALLGLLALFCPGYVVVVFLKSFSSAIQRLSFEDRCALTALLQLD